MVRSTFDVVVAAAVAASVNGTEPASAVARTAIPPPPADQEDRFTNIWDDSAWTITSGSAAVTAQPSASTPLGAAAYGAAGPAGPAVTADTLTPVNFPTH
jgi:hypothetical protein